MTGEKSIPTDLTLYNKIKNKVKNKFIKTSRWPSAYASGYLVQEYKKEFKNKYGNKSPYKTMGKRSKKNLSRWFNEKWVNVCKKKSGKYVACGRNKSSLKKYPYCRPLKRITKNTPMTVGEIKKKYGSRKLKSMCKRKNSKKNKKSMTYLKKSRKWSKKYKKSINCKKSKGFSQKQYCKSKNKK